MEDLKRINILKIIWIPALLATVATQNVCHDKKICVDRCFSGIPVKSGMQHITCRHGHPGARGPMGEIGPIGLQGPPGLKGSSGYCNCGLETINVRLELLGTRCSL